MRPNPLYLSQDILKIVSEISTCEPEYFMNVPLLLDKLKKGVESKIDKKNNFIRSLYNKSKKIYEIKKERNLNFLEKITYLFTSILVFKKIKKAISPNLQFLICGSAALNENTQDWFNMLNIPIFQIYGLTETTAIVTMDNQNTTKPGTVGLGIDGCEMKIDENGELLCRGPNIFSHYWNNPDATKQAFKEGWFCTGDLAEFDSYQRLTILGRCKELLVLSSGHNIYPEQIENQLKELLPSTVDQVMLVGHGKQYLIALVTGEITAQEISTHIHALNDSLPIHKKIRNFIKMPIIFSNDNGFLTANGKLRRQLILKNFSKEIEELYS
jgi:long-chain acyl-CoA synthetase